MYHYCYQVHFGSFESKIVEVFEKHGFIWVGSWYHFDTIHFEYRPELINYAN